jgi:hypothetical protein
MKLTFNKRDSIKNLLFLVLMMILLVPSIQSKFKWIKEVPLSGAFKPPVDTVNNSLSISSWFEGSFQELYDDDTRYKVGFRNLLIRLNNQLSYSLYSKANAEGVIVGRRNELFEEDYIREYLGQYFVGDSVWIKKALKLKAVQDTLASMGKTLVVIFEPDKASFYPELIPSQYQQIEKQPSNYDVLSLQLKNAGVNLLDLNKYFISIKNKTEYPLFPQCGTHWSYYGATLAADTAVSYLGLLTKTDLPDVIIKANEELDIPRHPDYDIGLAMNLMFTIPHPKTVNPIIEIKNSNKVKRPDVLLVGDSFYFNWLNNLIPAKVFNTCDFWYYNKMITTSDGVQRGEATHLDFRSEVLKRDIIIIMVTGRFIHSFAWGFDEQLYDLFFPGYINPVERFSNQIRIYDDNFKRLYKDAVDKNLSLPTRIEEEAKYMFYDDAKVNPDKYTNKRDILIIYEMGIRGSPDWMEQIKAKAVKNNVSVDEQIRRDAEWMYNDKYGKKG